MWNVDCISIKMLLRSKRASRAGCAEKNLQELPSRGVGGSILDMWKLASEREVDPSGQPVSGGEGGVRVLFT